MKGDVRKAMLESIAAHPGDQLQYQIVVKDVCHRVEARSVDEQQTVLTCWHDLMRTGLLAWGLDVSNANPPFAHLTEAGRRTLKALSRDPSNPEGYLAALAAELSSDPVAWSYIVEAVGCYNAGCFKACAVMVGAAGEALVLGIRDALSARLLAYRIEPSKDLLDWRIKRVLDAIEGECSRRAKAMPKGLAEPFESYWSSFTSHLRFARNEAGHPKSIEPVTEDAVHGSLLIFPELTKLVRGLREWIASSAFTS